MLGLEVALTCSQSICRLVRLWTRKLDDPRL